MRFRYVSPALYPDGYGEYGRGVIMSLLRGGHDVTVSYLRGASESPSRFGHAGKVVNSLVGKTLDAPPEVNIVGSTPSVFGHYRLPGALNLGLTMYESTNVPETYITSMNLMDGILTPSSWNARAFIELGLRKPVFVVHPAIAERRAASTYDHNPFTFFSVFEWRRPHKDWRSLVLAYLREFHADEPVLLRMKTFERDHEGSIERDVLSVKSELGLERCAKIELVIGSISSKELWDYYGKTSVYVSSHHGEGWGMPISEAMSIGVPAIATRFGGNLEFMTEENSYLVGYEHDRRKGWANVDVDELGRAMRRTYEQKAESSLRGTIGMKDVLETLTSKATAKSITDAVEALRPRTSAAVHA